LPTPSHRFFSDVDNAVKDVQETAAALAAAVAAADGGDNDDEDGDEDGRRGDGTKRGRRSIWAVIQIDRCPACGRYYSCWLWR